jgi:hypothetical protein
MGSHMKEWAFAAFKALGSMAMYCFQQAESPIAADTRPIHAKWDLNEDDHIWGALFQLENAWQKLSKKETIMMI